MAKVFRTMAVPLAALTKHRCAWAGCSETIPMASRIPKDWRWLALWWGPVAVQPWADGNIESRDAVLCPKHWRELDGLLEDIGQKLNTTEGSA